MFREQICSSVDEYCQAIYEQAVKHGKDNLRDKPKDLMLGFLSPDKEWFGISLNTIVTSSSELFRVIHEFFNRVRQAKEAGDAEHQKSVKGG